MERRPREDMGRRQCLPSKERGLGRYQLCPRLDPRLPASGTGRTCTPAVQASGCGPGTLTANPRHVLPAAPPADEPVPQTDVPRGGGSPLADLPRPSPHPSGRSPAHAAHGL